MLSLKLIALGALFLLASCEHLVAREGLVGVDNRTFAGADLFSGLQGREAFGGLSSRQNCAGIGLPCDGRCCPFGQICSPGPTHPGLPCCAGSLCNGGAGCCATAAGCCPSNSCCNPPKTCCGSACCGEGTTCCGGKTCCAAGRVCDAEAGVCRSTPSSSSSISSSSTSKSSSSSSRTSTLSTPRISTSKISTSTTSSSSASSTRKPSSSSSCDAREIHKRIITTGVCSPACPLPTPVATVVFTYTTTVTPIYPASVLATATNLPNYLDNGRLLQNVCQGMAKMKTGMGPGQSVTLTYNGGGSLSAQNRRGMCKSTFNGDERSLCRHQDTKGRDGNMYYYPHFMGEDLLNVKYLELECDEFPFASSCEGGEFTYGSTWCVSRWENNWGSTQMSKQVGLGRKVKAGQRFVVQVDPSSWDCGAMAPPGGGTKKRDDLLSENFSGNELFLDMFGQGTNAMSLFVDDLDPGSYMLNMNITHGSFASASLISKEGEIFTETSAFSNSTNNQSIFFTVPEEVPGARFLALTRDKEVNLSYTVSNRSQPVEYISSAAGTCFGLRLLFLALFSVGFIFV